MQMYQHDFITNTKWELLMVGSDAVLDTTRYMESENQSKYKILKRPMYHSFMERGYFHYD